MARVAALLYKVLGGLPGDSDLHKPGQFLRRVLAKVRTQPALTVMNLFHALTMQPRPNSPVDHA